MVGFPIFWEEETDELDICVKALPYSDKEIKNYLHESHYHYMLDEEPTTFQTTGPHATKEDGDRYFWLLEARDMLKKRQWFVVVGTGKSPFDVSKKMKRWMYARTNDNNASPEEFLDEEYDEQIFSDVGT